jgi:hypothetical protein
MLRGRVTSPETSNIYGREKHNTGCTFVTSPSTATLSHKEPPSAGTFGDISAGWKTQNDFLFQSCHGWEYNIQMDFKDKILSLPHS